MVLPSAVQPLVTVIIPCYNQGKYVAQAIESIIAQTYKYYEIIVVDDGSVDNTKAVIRSFEGIIYVYQENQGPSAARNKGVKHSKGEYIVFLDSDDILLPEALQANLTYLLDKPELAFVAGAHQFHYEEDNEVREVVPQVKENHYCYLLQSNYIAMIATVMFQRWVFDEYCYDTLLKICEDYDLYLNVARKYPVYQHTQILAIYRIHGRNNSGNPSEVLEAALLVLKRQESVLQNNTEKQWLKDGIAFWKWYYSQEIYKQLNVALTNGSIIIKNDVESLKKHNNSLYRKFIIQKKLAVVDKLIKKSKGLIKNLLPGYILKRIVKFHTPAPGKVDLGDLNRVRPFSEQFGYDRGGPVDRYYIENFLQKYKHVVQGRALEIGDNEYTLQYGENKITKSDILHIDASNPKATFTGDLSDAPQLPDNSFDCIILTQTLHLIYNYKGAIETCYRVLKPGGTLLITVPGISHIAQDEWGKYWLWSFTDSSLKRILAEFFSPDRVNIETFGNVLVATAFLYGMGLPELSQKQMDSHDPHYQVIITASAVK